MKITNLDCNILHELGHGWGCRDAPGPYHLHRICRHFADIPAPKVRNAVVSLQTAGLVKIQHSPREVILTDEAMQRIKASRQCFEHVPEEHLTTCIGILCRNTGAIGTQ